jgi:hypothetical protein
LQPEYSPLFAFDLNLLCRKKSKDFYYLPGFYAATKAMARQSFIHVSVIIILFLFIVDISSSRGNKELSDCYAYFSLNFLKAFILQ